MPDQECLPRSQLLGGDLQKIQAEYDAEGHWPTLAELDAQVPPELRERWDYVMSLRPKTRKADA